MDQWTPVDPERPLPRLNLLAPPRLTAFTLLYGGEGLPQGFATAAVALELKRMGLGAEALGVFSASIVAMQIGMITLTPRRPAPAEVVPVGATA